MNRHARRWNLGIAFLGALIALEPIAALSADRVNLRFTCDRKRFDVDQETKGNQAVKAEQWGYNVRVENTSFKDLQGLRIEYLLFGEEDIPGSKASRELCTKGSVELADFLKNQRHSFVTESLTTTSSQLDSDWRWDSGAPTRSRGRLVGIWIKVFQNGQEVAQYANPTTLTKKDWDNPVPAPKSSK